MSTPQTYYTNSSFNPSAQMTVPVREGPIRPGQGWGRNIGTGDNQNRRQAPEPRCNGGQVKWNASAPANPNRQRCRGGRGRRGQHANQPPRGENPTPLNHGHQSQSHGHQRQNQTHPHHHNNRHTQNLHGGAENPRPNQGVRNLRPGHETHRNQRQTDNRTQNRPQQTNNNRQPRQQYQTRPSKQGIQGRNNPLPVFKRGIDLDGDSTMTGMPFYYSRQVWTDIQRKRQVQHQQLLESHFTEIIQDKPRRNNQPQRQNQPAWDFDVAMNDAPPEPQQHLPSYPQWDNSENQIAGASNWNSQYFDSADKPAWGEEDLDDIIL
ncbi:hypothetical protein BJY04DRAFT_216229 [Aspergillus karnatakaensis]|uniref:uncharacterized protein n=1 Tax=Aspergillus karnatakaensis TaxID=1810916 RepID=UPI003CCCBB7C